MLALSHLFDMSLETGSSVPLGDTPAGFSQIDVLSGSFAGPYLSGAVTGGFDRLTRGSDGRFRPDALLLLRTDAGITFEMRYTGVAQPTEAEFARILAGEAVDYYHRTLVRFTAGDPALDRLNGLVAVGTGRIRAQENGALGVEYRIFGID